MSIIQNQLQKAINLAKKTGDRIIIFDSARPSDAYAVMSLDEYERLVVKRCEVSGLTEEELIDKINRDIANWKNKNEYGGVGMGITDPESEEEKNKTMEDFYLKHEKKPLKNSWAIPKERKKTAEEIIEEDRQYLEF